MSSEQVKPWEPRPYEEIAKDRASNPDYERGRQEALDWTSVVIAELAINGAPFFHGDVCGFCGVLRQYEHDEPEHHKICLYQRSVDRIARGGGPREPELTTWESVTAVCDARADRE